MVVEQLTERDFKVTLTLIELRLLAGIKADIKRDKSDVIAFCINRGLISFTKAIENKER